MDILWEVTMVRRPNVFDQQEFEESLRNLGCSESFVKPITSDFRLFVPVVLRELGEKNLFKIVDGIWVYKRGNINR